MIAENFTDRLHIALTQSLKIVCFAAWY